jgi:Domain of unknown function (DUF4129)
VRPAIQAWRALLADPPAPDRPTGQRWAREELAKGAYARARPSLTSRAFTWVVSRLGDISRHTGVGPGRLLAIVLVLALTAVAVVVLLRRGVRSGIDAPGGGHSVLGRSTLSGAEHRALAEAARSRGDHAGAVRESMRAVARRLDERALLDPRPGRTADELAREAGRLLPELSTRLQAGAQVFDDVSYGAGRAERADAEQLWQLDLAVEAARPVAAVGFSAMA